MVFRSMRSRGFFGIAACVTILALTGCQSGGPLGALNLGADGDDAGQQQAAAQEGRSGDGALTTRDLTAFCPSVVLREGTAYHNTYQRGGEGDRSKLIYQASIGDVTRECDRGAGSISMNVAVAGRIVPGPAGKTGTITMPIRVAVLRGEEVLYSELHQYDVQVSDTAGATQFIFNDPNIVIPESDSRGVRVFAGYDEGPYETP